MSARDGEAGNTPGGSAPAASAVAASTPDASATDISPVRRWTITFTVMLVSVLQILDTSVTNVALPNIQGALSAGVEEVSGPHLLPRRQRHRAARLRLAHLAARAAAVLPGLHRDLHRCALASRAPGAAGV